MVHSHNSNPANHRMVHHDRCEENTKMKKKEEKENNSNNAEEAENDNIVELQQTKGIVMKNGREKCNEQQ